MSEQIFTDDMFEKVEKKNRNPYHIDRPSVTYWGDAWRRLKKNKAFIIPVVVMLAIVALAIVGPALRDVDYRQQNPKAINTPPSTQYWFGTDSLGRDIFVRCWFGARVSLFIAVVATFFNVTIGIVYGGLSGYMGGKADMVMMRMVEIIYSIPSLLWVMMLMIVMGQGLKTIIIAISITGWGSMARLVRGEVLKLKQMEYVLAARTLGAGFGRIITKHLIPNAMGPIIINLTFSIPGAIFTEAMLSYLGVGIPVPLASWGTLVNEGAKMLLIRPHQLFFPAGLLCVTMLSFNLIGDGLRDALDPRLRR